MSISLAKARLYVEHSLESGRTFRFEEEQSHYLMRVMRLHVGDHVSLFNGRDGEWEAELTSTRQKAAEAICTVQTRQQTNAPDLWLLFAPLKKSRTDFAVEKATELGVSVILPVRTELTNTRRVSVQRLRLVAREAAEQCLGLAVPEIREFTNLSSVLDSWPSDRPLVVCDEMLRKDATVSESLLLDRIDNGTGIAVSSDIADNWDARGKLAVLVGPEGGFSPNERERLQGFAHSIPVGLGSRLLRAETAVTAALSIVNIGKFRL
ncbi:MAG: 16S rRNA (uracil(1498)-N(3))-methyltransferase [Rhodobacteraceae bacterium]|nr:16S rRNA (uracil(1498)-N(3))-methyltransferase [Paracoccaceae bacterium]